MDIPINALEVSPQSQLVINNLLNQQTYDGIKQYSDDAVKLLRVIIENYYALDLIQGPDQAKRIRELFISYSVSPESSKTIILDNTLPITSKWRLHSLRCCSFRGIAPYGKDFEFKFDEKSHLIYGPNGSGKSSFLDAITWALWGLIVLDLEFHDKTDLDFGTSKQPWPIIVSLPDSVESEPSCFVELELRDTSRGNGLWIKRELNNTEMKCRVRESENDEGVSCSDFSSFGISPLDIQLSVVAPAILNKKLLDDSTEVAEILYGIIGYDSLDKIGKFASKALGNCTRLVNDENGHIRRITSEILLYRDGY